MRAAEEGGAGAAYTGDLADMPVVGVLGGGQLGKMLATAAVSVLPSDHATPCCPGGRGTIAVPLRAIHALFST